MEVVDRMHERLAVSLAGDIISGRKPEGSEFSTGDDLTRAYGVSRTVAREALQALTAAGLVHVQHGKRTVVNGVSEWRFFDVLLQRAMQSERLPDKLVRDLYGTRALIESETARLCALNADASVLQTLERILERSKELAESVADDPATVGDVLLLDRAFHDAIGDGSGNVILARVARDAHRGALVTWDIEHLHDRERLRVIQRQHRKIAKAIMDRDPDAAKAAMQRHIDWSLKDTLQTRGAPSSRHNGR